MLNDRLAPLGRAALFFGFMAAAVACLTFGAGLQIRRDQSSESIALARGERQIPMAVRFATVDPIRKPVSSARRASATSQQAMHERHAAILR